MTRILLKRVELEPGRICCSGRELALCRRCLILVAHRELLERVGVRLAGCSRLD